MSKHSFKHSLALVFGLAVPVMALSGCPFPGLGGTNPSPTPTVAATPSRATGVVITKVDLPTGSDTDKTLRNITLKNLGTADVDLTKYAVSYEYFEGGASKMQHLRIAGGKKIAGGATLNFKDSSTELTKEDDLGGSGAATLGIQLGQGSLVLYKGVESSTDLTSTNIADYVQYGSANTYTHVDNAVTAKVWDAKDKYAPGPGSIGKSIQVIVAGNIGSTNWEAK